jgi:hypothetical protein
MVTEMGEKIPKFSCLECGTKTNNKKDYEKHILTAKHQKMVGGDNLGDKGDKNVCKINLTCLTCNKVYKSRNGLWKHSKTCEDISPKTNNESSKIINLFIKENSDFKNIILDIVKNNNELQKHNQELHQQVLDVCQKNQPLTINTNSHNKTFNLQFFLNEQCKDAMNIMDFVNTFQLQFSDLERIGEVGYVEGISNIVIDKLNEMDVYKRPIHCSDAKREIMHVKDNDVWTKDNANNDKIRLALKYITKKNIDLIRPWAIANPGALNSDHRLNDKYQLMVIEAMGGNKNKTMKEGEDKIIKKISRMVLINKNV